MNITARLQCTSVSRTSASIGGDGVRRYNETLKLLALDFEDSDAAFPQDNPGATINIEIVNQAAPGTFEPGAEYDVTVVPAT